MKFIEFLSLAPPKHQSEGYPTTSKDFFFTTQNQVPNTCPVNTQHPNRITGQNKRNLKTLSVENVVLPLDNHDLYQLCL